MIDPDLLHTLRLLEIELHQPATRANAARLDQLLHESFLEFGKSGTIYSKADILRQLAETAQAAKIWSGQFAVSELEKGVALLTYKSAHADQSGNLSLHALRSSIWVHTPAGWQVRFHQGTPTQSFSDHTDDALVPVDRRGTAS